MVFPVYIVLALPGAEPLRSIDFATEIIPVLTKAGCNAGSCHGAAAGRGGFRLSLFGGDSAADYDAIVQELEGRRINLVRPDHSLMLLKPTGALKHGGGARLDETAVGARRLHDWIAAGALRSQKLRQLTSFVIQPANRVVERSGDEVPLRAIARFDNGSDEDVTAFTVFASSDNSAVEVATETGVATVRRRGQHVIIARFLDRVLPVRLSLPFADQPLDLSRQPRNNFIDDEVLKNLGVLRIPASPSADDAAFLRRIRLDLSGRLPDIAEVESFVKDRAPDKRVAIIDKLLASDEFAEYWTYKVAVLLRNRPATGEKEGAETLHRWLRERLREGAAFDTMARDLLTELGDSHKVGPAFFNRLTNDARGQAELVSSVFLGARLQCANCHHHPLDRWTQDDYHGLAAIFARLERGREVKIAARGAVTNPRTGEPAVPRLPGTRYLDEAADGRGALAQWITAKENPQFARATVNRLWKAMFGRGLVEPADDLRDTNPATHPELLDRLAQDFVEHKFDLRHTLRLIAASETYGRGGATVAGNETDDRFYSHAYRRPLEAEVLADALADVTGVPEKYGNHPLGTRAIALVDPTTPSRSLDVLGRCSRQDSCESGAARGGLPGVLHQLNGELVNRKITAPEGRLHRMIAAKSTIETIVSEFYLRAFGRPASTDELRFWKEHAAKVNEKERTAWLEDALWSLLNSREFATNH